jgi:lipid A ethanolaminephosphotransferase
MYNQSKIKHLLDMGFKKPISVTLLILIVAVYIIAIDNVTFWSLLSERMGNSVVDNILITTSLFMFILTLIFLLASLFSHIKMIKPVLIFFLISSSLISYFIDDYGTVISYSMIQNVIETDTHEAFDLLNLGLLLHVLLYGVVPSIVVFLIKLKQTTSVKEIYSRMTALMLLVLITSSSVYASYKELSFLGRENRDLRYYINPVYPIISLYKHIKISNKNKHREFIKIYKDSVVNNMSYNQKKPKLLVLVVGETARADSFSLNGYSRNTTPKLAQQDIINFSNTSSCGTATAESLPCMFSDIEHNSFDLDKIRHRENLLDALSYAGIDTLWRDNNSGCKGVCARSKTEFMNTITDTDLCNGDECYDEILLHNLKAKIAEITKDTVFILHQQGSHGPAYYKRVPNEYAVFQPLCSSKAVQDCSNAQVTNSYDNTIYYTDYFLDSVIKMLKAKNNVDTAMIYMSDHGESLGENGIYLHGLPYFMAPKEQTHIPFIIWLSDKIQNSENIDTNCMKNISSQAYSHDNLLHSVLGLMNVKTKHYKADRDVFSGCSVPNSVRLSLLD